MAYEFIQKSGKHTYICLGRAYRDEKGRPRSKREYIGKIDPETGERIYKAEYLKRLEQEGVDTTDMASDAVFNNLDISASSVRQYGVFQVLRKLSEDIGLSDCLEQAFPEEWQQILSLAFFLTVSEDPLTYCEDWLKDSDSFEIKALSPQRIYKLLENMGADERDRFFELWNARQPEDEYLALDITSGSSCSALPVDDDWSYNRDGEDPTQINLCLLLGKRSRLPLYQLPYQGSLPDVSALQALLAEFRAITHDKPVVVVLDREAYSPERVDAMLAGEGEAAVPFLISAPVSAERIVEWVEQERGDIERPLNIQVLRQQLFYSVNRKKEWREKESIQVLFILSPELAFRAKDHLMKHVVHLRDEARKEPGRYLDNSFYTKYLEINPKADEDSEYATVITKDEVTENELLNSGLTVLLGNTQTGAVDAVRIYHDKAVLGMAFGRLKCSLDLKQLRSYSRKILDNKLFVLFLALCLQSAVHQVMEKHGLDKVLTMKQIFRTLATHRVQTIAGQRIVQPTTKHLKAIYKAFGIKQLM
ncbi:MAG: hypothetical protein QM296_13065 [Bacillota bacterium]|nr:hypothetical protein [Bacillota bacterium]